MGVELEMDDKYIWCSAMTLLGIVAVGMTVILNSILFLFIGAGSIYALTYGYNRL